MQKFTKSFVAVTFASLALTACTHDKILTAQPITETIANKTLSAKPITAMLNLPYGKFSTYHWTNEPHIEPATGGVLVEKNGCLLIESSEGLNVPLLPNEKTRWDDSTKTLNYFGKKIKLGQKIVGAGRANVDPLKPTVKYIQQARPECLEGRKFMVFWG